MSQDKGNFKNRRNRGYSHNKQKNQINLGDKGKEILENINEDSLVIKQFQEYSNELTSKHDRFERIVKISRDITIESKRIISLLHTFDKESKRTTVLGEADKRINNVMKTLFRNIAYELDGEDPYMYVRAYRPGLQEFVEAYTFYSFLENNSLCNWTNIATSMTYTIADSEQTESDENVQEVKTVKALIPPDEYILGIADLTGELMRKCISNLASGDISSCYQTCNFVRNMYKEFLGCVGISGKAISRKVYILRQSLLKMENVCYMIKVRGSEIPKHMLADIAIGAVTTEGVIIDDDEGIQVY